MIDELIRSKGQALRVFMALYVREPQSVHQLTESTGLGRTAILNAIGELKRLDLIHAQITPYLLKWAARADCMSPPGWTAVRLRGPNPERLGVHEDGLPTQISSPGRQGGSLEAARADSGVPPVEPASGSVPPSGKPPSPTPPIVPPVLSPLLAPESPPEDLFDRFWRQWPRKVAKADAKKAWGKLNRTDQRAALMTLKAWVAHLKTRELDKVPYPATFLRRGDWQEAPPSQDSSEPDKGLERPPEPECPACKGTGWVEDLAGGVRQCQHVLLASKRARQALGDHDEEPHARDGPTTIAESGLVDVLKQKVNS